MSPGPEKRKRQRCEVSANIKCQEDLCLFPPPPEKERHMETITKNDQKSTINISRLFPNPNQPRKVFNRERLMEFGMSLEEIASRAAKRMN